MISCSLNILLITFYNWPYLYVWILYGFLARTMCGPRLDPQAWLVLFISKKTNWTPSFVAGPPKRLAQFGALFLGSSSLILYLSGEQVPAMWFMGIIILFSSLQAFLYQCVVCMLFYFLVMLHLVPESLCLSCKVQFKTTVQHSYKSDSISLNVNKN
jgi:hypothetical protein